MPPSWQHCRAEHTIAQPVTEGEPSWTNPRDVQAQPIVKQVGARIAIAQVQPCRGQAPPKPIHTVGQGFNIRTRGVGPPLQSWRGRANVFAPKNRPRMLSQGERLVKNAPNLRCKCKVPEEKNDIFRVGPDLPGRGKGSGVTPQVRGHLPPPPHAPSLKQTLGTQRGQ